ncbi:MAG: SUMF1/EgtB/PvdO family nonheme iron enzyme [Candidatus Tectimicrobiota bacterium]
MAEDLSAQIETLRRELARLEAQHSAGLAQPGSGAVAQDGSVAGGERAVAAGAGGVAIGDSVRNSMIVTGSLEVRGDVYLGQPSRDAEEALTIYRRVLLASTYQMSLRGLDVRASDATSTQQHFDLAQVYVELQTTTQVPVQEERQAQGQHRERAAAQEMRPLGALEAVQQQRLTVLLGDPGSGKSTFLTHLGLCLAAHGLEPHGPWLARLNGWPATEAQVMPVSVVLRDFARWLPAGVRQAEAFHLWQFMTARLTAQNLGFVAPILEQRLEQGQVLLLLDGLDEMPTPQQRIVIGAALDAFLARYTQCRAVVTCRTLSYHDPAWQLEAWTAYTLAAFSAPQIEHFIAAWYQELQRLGSMKAEEAARAAQHLHAAVRRPDLWRLAANPLLLTVMALVHTHKGRLPEARALLYEETVDLLLWRWEQLKSSGSDDLPRLRQLLAQAERTDVDLKRVLWDLAFAAQRSGGSTDTETAADIGEGALANALRALHPSRSRDWAYEVIEVMKLRAGLLLERLPEVYAFPHRTFQEYLAGAYLSTQADFAREATALSAAGALWREVILLAVGRLVHLSGETAKPLALVAELCPQQAADTPEAWRQVWLAGDVLLEIGLNRVRDTALGRELATRVGDRLVALLRGGHLRAVERVAAGNTLGRLGDPRFLPQAWYLPDEPLLGLVAIPAGSFTMGSRANDALAFDDERPQHTLRLPLYYMAHYPVTVAQFCAFVDESGHEPADRRSLQGQPHHPVVYVSWYDAQAYCQWLTERLRVWEETPEPLATLLREQRWCVMLPSEAEWEKAARGRAGRRYPWGKDIAVERANYGETGIGTTSAVGCFPGGASPFGVEELSGNVWEWTRSLWGGDLFKPTFVYPYNAEDGREDLQASADMLRVLRGGAFWADPPNVRCAYRLGSVARGVGSLVGCRVGVRPCL